MPSSRQRSQQHLAAGTPAACCTHGLPRALIDVWFLSLSTDSTAQERFTSSSLIQAASGNCRAMLVHDMRFESAFSAFSTLPGCVRPQTAPPWRAPAAFQLVALHAVNTSYASGRISTLYIGIHFQGAGSADSTALAGAGGLQLGDASVTAALLQLLAAAATPGTSDSLAAPLQVRNCNKRTMLCRYVSRFGDCDQLQLLSANRRLAHLTIWRSRCRCGTGSAHLRSADICAPPAAGRAVQGFVDWPHA